MKVQSADRKRVILDASSAILISKAGLHEALACIYSLVLAESVFQEITAKPCVGSVEFLGLFAEGSIEVLPTQSGKTSSQVKLAALDRLDTGEKDSLLLYLSGVGDFIITDDGPAARLCKNQNIPFLNALLVPKILALSGRVNADLCEKLFAKIEKNGRYSERIKCTARNMTASDLQFFMPRET